MITTKNVVIIAVSVENRVPLFHMKYYWSSNLKALKLVRFSMKILPVWLDTLAEDVLVARIPKAFFATC